MAQYNIFNIYDVFDSVVADGNGNNSVVHQIGTLSTATGNVGQTGDVYQKAAQRWLACGISSLPAAPNGTADCAQSISISMSDTDMIIATRDTRYQSYCNDQAPGDVYLYATGTGVSNGIKIKAAGNAINMNGDTIDINANIQVNITAPMTQIGDNSARFVAHSDEVVTILTAMLTEIAADISLLTTPPTSTTFTAYAPAKATLLGTLQTAISAQLATLPTTKGKIT